VAGLERGVELTHAFPVLGDPFGVDGLIGAPDQRCKRIVVAVGIDPVDALGLDSSDARAEAQAQHGVGLRSKGVAAVILDAAQSPKNLDKRHLHPWNVSMT
jgi:hypothetical protein